MGFVCTTNPLTLCQRTPVEYQLRQRIKVKHVRSFLTQLLLKDFQLLPTSLPNLSSRALAASLPALDIACDNWSDQAQPQEVSMTFACNPSENRQFMIQCVMINWHRYCLLRPAAVEPRHRPRWRPLEPQGVPPNSLSEHFRIGGETMREKALSAALFAGIVLGPSGLVLAENAYPIAGMDPSERPRGAPIIQSVQRDSSWYVAALTGVSQPYPNSLSFLEDQGNWYTPFNRPGMPGRYDIRGWYRQ